MNELIIYLNSIPTEIMWFVQLASCYIVLLLMLRFFGKAGMFVFIAISVIAANIEVLKVAKFAMFSHPIALGTIFFSFAFLATDVLTEYYGAKVARRAILIGFAGALLMLLFMTLELSFKPLTAGQSAHFNVLNQASLQSSLLTIFSTTPALITASLFSYLCSQFTDVWIFKTVKKITSGKYLWLRTNASTMLAAVLDTIIFNVLAWRLFAAHPMVWGTLFYTYMLSTWGIRVVISILGTPAVYLARHMLPKRERSS